MCQILSWEFCARSHEELLPRRLIVPQVSAVFGFNVIYIIFSADIIEMLPTVLIWHPPSVAK